jgi:hypothetical protein
MIAEPSTVGKVQSADAAPPASEPIAIAGLTRYLSKGNRDITFATPAERLRAK